MKILDRESLLLKQVLAIEKVELGEGAYVFVRQMTGRERDQWEQSLMKEVKTKKGMGEFVRSLEDFRAKLAVHTVCDEHGVNLLKPNDAALLSMNMGAARLELIVNKAQELNKITEEDKEDLVKNLERGQSEDSTSDSPEN